MTQPDPHAVDDLVLGRDRGAVATFLQVDLANDVAHRVYEHAGFVAHHTHHYLAAPPGTDPQPS